MISPAEIVNHRNPVIHRPVVEYDLPRQVTPSKLLVFGFHINNFTAISSFQRIQIFSIDLWGIYSTADEIYYIRFS